MLAVRRCRFSPDEDCPFVRWLLEVKISNKVVLCNVSTIEPFGNELVGVEFPFTKVKESVFINRKTKWKRTRSRSTVRVVIAAVFLHPGPSVLGIVHVSVPVGVHHAHDRVDNVFQLFVGVDGLVRLIWVLFGMFVLFFVFGSRKQRKQTSN